MPLAIHPTTRMDKITPSRWAWPSSYIHQQPQNSNLQPSPSPAKLSYMQHTNFDFPPSMATTTTVTTIVPTTTIPANESPDLHPNLTKTTLSQPDDVNDEKSLLLLLLQSPSPTETGIGEGAAYLLELPSPVSSFASFASFEFKGAHILRPYDWDSLIYFSSYPAANPITSSKSVVASNSGAASHSLKNNNASNIKRQNSINRQFISAETLEDLLTAKNTYVKISPSREDLEGVGRGERRFWLEMEVERKGEGMGMVGLDGNGEKRKDSVVGE